MCEERRRRNGHNVTRNTTRKLSILETKIGFDVRRRRRRILTVFMFKKYVLE
jgi:hypothetical protein